MIPAIDVSLRILDPLDDHRLFDMRADAAEMEALIDERAPGADTGSYFLVAPTYYLLARGVEDMAAVNDFLVAQRRRCPGIRGLFGVVEPKYGDQAIAGLERLARAGATGVVWSPRAQGMFGDDLLLADLVRRAHALGLLSMMRAAPYSTNEALWRTWRLAEQCENIPILVSGALQNFDSAQMISQSAGGPANLHYDTAGWTVSTFLPRLTVILGQRLLFGTGGLEPFASGAERIVEALGQANVAEGMIGGLLGAHASCLIPTAGREARP